MKVLFFLLVILLGCKSQSKEEAIQDGFHIDSHVKLEKGTQELIKFEKLLINLYTESLKNAEKVILKADRLLIENKAETDPIKLMIKTGISNSLHYLKGELFFKLGKYDKSLLELSQFTSINSDVAIALASNYSKLKRFDKAKSFIDSIGRAYYLYNYALGNYYENIGDKKNALIVYTSIKNDKSVKHYGYYKLALKRIDELQKEPQILLDEIYFPTRNPSLQYKQ